MLWAYRMMTQRIALAGVMALAVLTACSKPAATPPVEEQPAATAAVTEPEVAKPSMGPADYPAQLLPFIDAAPQCQEFRTQLEAAGQVQSSEPLPVDMNEVNAIVAKAAEAGCYRKP
jgi:hypothetical protein